MSLTNHSVASAVCTNYANCPRAFHSEPTEWYPGPGEYCPDCGEALALRAPDDAAWEPSARATVSERVAEAAPLGPTAVAEPAAAPEHGAPRPAARRTRFLSPLRWFWLVAAIGAIGAAAFFGSRRDVAADRAAPAPIAICPLSSARQFAADLVRAYIAKNGLAADGFVVAGGETASCDIRFSTAAETPEAVVARDGIVAIVNPLNPIARISESDVRGIFSGTIRDWSQIGGPRGPIVALLPNANSDEAKVLAAGLLFGLPVGGTILRGGSSADVTRTVAGADRTARHAIGLVAFSQAVSAKVVPLSYLPPPSVLTIASRRYPYTLTLALRSATRRSAGTVAGLIQYARSSDGAAIVQKNGLVSPEGP